MGLLKKSPPCFSGSFSQFAEFFYFLTFVEQSPVPTETRLCQKYFEFENFCKKNVVDVVCLKNLYFLPSLHEWLKFSVTVGLISRFNSSH